MVLSFRFIATRDWSDDCMRVEAHSFRRCLCTQRPVHSGISRGAVHDRYPGIPARFGAKVHPVGEVTGTRDEERT